MKTYLRHIADIRTGLFAKPGSSGEVVYLQARHFDENGQLHDALHPDLMVENIAEKHLLKPGDVLFAAKGSKNFAAVYEAHNPPAVASTSFFVIQLTVDSVRPAYLAWLLNSTAVQTLLKSQAIGTSLPSISKEVLMSLEIPIPILETQETILKITRLRLRERALKERIESLKDKQIQYYITAAIQHDND